MNVMMSFLHHCLLLVSVRKLISGGVVEAHAREVHDHDLSSSREQWLQQGHREPANAIIYVERPDANLIRAKSTTDVARPAFDISELRDLYQSSDVRQHSSVNKYLTTDAHRAHHTAGSEHQLSLLEKNLHHEQEQKTHSPEYCSPLHSLPLALLQQHSTYSDIAVHNRLRISKAKIPNHVIQQPAQPTGPPKLSHAFCQPNRRLAHSPLPFRRVSNLPPNILTPGLTNSRANNAAKPSPRQTTPSTSFAALSATELAATQTCTDSYFVLPPDDGGSASRRVVPGTMIAFSTAWGSRI